MTNIFKSHTDLILEICPDYIIVLYPEHLFAQSQDCGHKQWMSPISKLNSCSKVPVSCISHFCCLKLCVLVHGTIIYTRQLGTEIISSFSYLKERCSHHISHKCSCYKVSFNFAALLEFFFLACLLSCSLYLCCSLFRIVLRWQLGSCLSSFFASLVLDNVYYLVWVSGSSS